MGSAAVVRRGFEMREATKGEVCLVEEWLLVVLAVV